MLEERGVDMRNGLSALLSKILSLISGSAGIRGLSEPEPPSLTPLHPCQHEKGVCVCACVYVG